MYFLFHVLAGNDEGGKWIAKAAEQGLEGARDMLKLLDDLLPKQNGED
ncbi:MAG: hypothetical protein LUE13_10790 [Akkermansiaceae bacterium]|nr:hypothetical protein [Akkermansiaceae bacterium]